MTQASFNATTPEQQQAYIASWYAYDAAPSYGATAAYGQQGATGDASYYDPAQQQAYYHSGYAEQ